VKRALTIVSVLAIISGLAVGEGSADPRPGVMEFPRDFGSHSESRVEWWYVTGWLHTATGASLGFEFTLFRVRPENVEANPSAFNPSQLLMAHCVISDPQRGHPWQAQRIRRAGFGLVEASNTDTDVRLDDWRLQRQADGYHADADAGPSDSESGERFGLHLRLEAAGPPMLNGLEGYSRKGPEPASASEYYSVPHLRVSGTVDRGGRTEVVTGEAWLDHEWASRYLDPEAVGWDWVGLNLDDGGALMAFRIRGRDGTDHWAGGTILESGVRRTLGPDDVHFIPERQWRSPRSGVVYPITWRLQLPDRTLQLSPLMDDQEIDSRASTGAFYWEGAVNASAAGHASGRGYLELTGYDKPLSLP
jgi:predicted secreted hydrolase